MQQEWIKYPIGIQNFESLRKEGFVYVDKTALIWEMANRGRYYFLSRPRRFGKSLLVSTLEAYFEGKRELFHGLAISELERDWECYPVLHIDLNDERYNSANDLVNKLNLELARWEAIYGKGVAETTLSARFNGIIRRASEKNGKGVVVLVDEYDKPMALNLTNEHLQDEFRSILKAFYSVLKSCDRYIRFALLTGVTKFSKVSVFSDLNNLDDISMWDKYIPVCGITEEEIRSNFDSGVGELAAHNGLTKDECYMELRRRYDGYHFCQDSIGIYNPFSLLHTLNKLQFGDYWFETGTPTLLVDLLKESNFNLNQLLDGEITGQLLNGTDSLKENPIPIMYQSGYLTIKSYDREFDEYHLGFPNDEVESGFINFLLPWYTNVRQDVTTFSISRFTNEIRTGQPEAFMNRLVAMMADTDYRIVGDAELYFQNFLFVFFRLLGLYVDVEYPTSSGRMDMIIQTPGYIYIIEFKLNQSADVALQQIVDKGYELPFVADSRKLYKIGVNFSTVTRCIDDWKVKEICSGQP